MSTESVARAERAGAPAAGADPGRLSAPTAFYRAMRSCPDLSSSARLIGFALAVGFMWTRDASGRYRAWPSQRRLSADTRLDPKTIRRALRELQAAGLLICERPRVWRTPATGQPRPTCCYILVESPGAFSAARDAERRDQVGSPATSARWLRWAARQGYTNAECERAADVLTHYSALWSKFRQGAPYPIADADYRAACRLARLYFDERIYLIGTLGWHWANPATFTDGTCVPLGQASRLYRHLPDHVGIIDELCRKTGQHDAA